jgi:hypothetical protein
MSKLCISRSANQLFIDFKNDFAGVSFVCESSFQTRATECGENLDVQFYVSARVQGAEARRLLR